MNWTEKQIKFIIQDMIEENPLACSALFKISSIEFTENVDTMAVKISSNPILYINLNFCRQHLLCENDVKAVLLHEFLHVLLLHTEKYKLNSPLLNICLDAIINAIIFRTEGLKYAGFFARFYKWEKIGFLLRPQCDEKNLEREWMDIHKSIYKGEYCADDLHELLQYLRSKIQLPNIKSIVFIGNHDHISPEVPEHIAEIFNNIIKKMNGVKIWSASHLIGTGDKMSKQSIIAEKNKSQLWNAATLTILKKCLMETTKKIPTLEQQQFTIPILSSNDKRSLSKYLYTGLMPMSNNIGTVSVLKPEEKVSVYLDVSGSMRTELNRLVDLLFHFKKYVNQPLWVFSDKIEKAFFRDNKLVFDTSFGTKIYPVFDHMRENNISTALIITDGYVDEISETMLNGLDRKKIQVIINADGLPNEFEKVGIQYTRLQPIT